jgi:hypothetical protein
MGSGTGRPGAGPGGSSGGTGSCAWWGDPPRLPVSLMALI